MKWLPGSVFGVIGIAASYAGTALNRHVNPDALLLAFGALVIVAADAMALRIRAPAVSDREHTALVMSGGSARAPSAVAPTTGPPPGETPDQSTAAPTEQPMGSATIVKLVLALAGLIVGFLTGFLGVGGGFVIVPALVMVLDFPMAIAVGTSLLIIAINSAAALAARGGTETFDWSVIAPFTIVAIVGSLAGKRVADRVSGPSLTRVRWPPGGCRDLRHHQQHARTRLAQVRGIRATAVWSPILRT